MFRAIIVIDYNHDYIYKRFNYVPMSNNNSLSKFYFVSEINTTRNITQKLTVGIDRKSISYNSRKKLDSNKWI